MENEKFVEANFDTFSINVAKYKTQLTKKYINRPVYAPKDPKLIKVFIPGTVIEVNVKQGKKVKQGDVLLVFEAMKMHNRVLSPLNGVIKKVNIKPGDLITKDTLLVELK